jgi:hypothetical protein
MAHKHDQTKKKSLYICWQFRPKKKKKKKGGGWDSLHKFTALRKQKRNSPVALSLFMVGVLDSLTTFQSLYSFFLFNGGKAKATSKKVREKIPGLPYIPIGRVHIIVYGWRCCSSSIGYTYIHSFVSLHATLYLHIRPRKHRRVWIFTTNLNNILYLHHASIKTEIYL